MMNIFEQKLSQDSSDDLPINPVQLYPKLFPKEGYYYLRGIQIEILEAWHNDRDKRDVVLKMNTGSGKTLTGLLMLYSKLVEGIENAVYVCPDNQLLAQTLEKADLYQIPVCTVSDSNHFPPEFLNGEKILVCTFNRLFNGLSIFKREKIQIGAIVIDDAHKCIDKARESTTLAVDDSHQIYKRLFKLFEEDLKEQLLSDYIRIKDGTPNIYARVPYWSWIEQSEKVLMIINEFYPEDDNVRFVWDLIADKLDTFECHFSGNKVEIAPYHVPYENVSSYHEAKFRYVMSATFSDSANLVKDLGLSKDSVLHPLIPKNTRDIGQRLILAPRRYDSSISDDKVRSIAKKFAEKGYNVSAIVPSSWHAEKWTELGAKKVTKESIEKVVEKLKKSSGNFYVFVNRYDGIDLLGNMCRLLILDDYPAFKSLYQIYRESKVDSLINGSKAQIIEQGIGRGVRSGTDYCAVLLLGDRLLSFVGYKANLESFTPITKEQMKRGLNLLNETPKTNSLQTVVDTIKLCLDQDDNWRKYHNKIVDSAANLEHTEFQKQSITLAEFEKVALRRYYHKEYKEAADEILKNIIDNKNLDLTDREIAWYYQLAGLLVYRHSKQLSTDLQIKAFKCSSKMLHPMSGTHYSKLETGDPQARRILKNLKRFTLSNDLIFWLEEILLNLKYTKDISADLFERSLAEIGTFLGFETQRPEKEQKQSTLDVLWLMSDGHFLIMEAKSRTNREVISKDDVEQLLHSIQWFQKSYGEHVEYTPVTVQPASKLDTGVVPQAGTKVLDSAGLELLIKSLRKFAAGVATYQISQISENEIASLLTDHKLTPSQFRSTYLKKV